MDELAFHPHPNSNTDSFLVGYRWPNAGTSNLGRIKQAVWDAFRGTAQPVFAEAGRPVRAPRCPAPVPPERDRLADGDPRELDAYYGRGPSPGSPRTAISPTSTRR